MPAKLQEDIRALLRDEDLFGLALYGPGCGIKVAGECVLLRVLDITPVNVERYTLTTPVPPHDQKAINAATQPERPAYLVYGVGTRSLAGVVYDENGNVVLC